MALTREVASAQLVVTVITLSKAEPSAQVQSSDVERRGGLIYVDPSNPGPAYLADTDSHAQARTNGAPMFPAAFPPGFELGVSGGIWVYALDSALNVGPVVVYFVAEVGQNPNHAD